MTLNAITLEQYFHLIVKPTETKEPTMFKDKIDYLKEKFISLWTKPVTFVDNKEAVNYEDGYWGFGMYTPEWVNEFGEEINPINTAFLMPHDGSWMDVLDTILDAMEKHYGYNIKEQVYYSVHFPVNTLDSDGTPLAGYGRCLNDELLQQVLLAHPELYLSPFQGAPEDLFA
jgi:hypothetical protein